MSQTTRTRRGRGEGAIYRRTDGLWVGSWSYLDAQGKRHRPTVYGKTKPEAAEKLRRFQESSGQLPDVEKLTVAAYLKRWLKDAVAQTVRPTTYDSYRYLVESHIIPVIGRLPLHKLQPLHIQHLLADKQQAVRSAPASTSMQSCTARCARQCAGS